MIPDHHSLAEMFSNVTSSMLDLDCEAATDGHDVGIYHTTAVLPIPGDGGFTLAVSSDLQGCTSLSAAMFAVETTEVDSEMINDTLAELANMAAGQLKGMLHLQNSLGLPIVKPTSDYRAKVSNGGGWSHYPMKAGKAKVLLSITTETSVAEEYMRS
jgi:CheY-specific phosphatase CheX